MSRRFGFFFQLLISALVASASAGMMVVMLVLFAGMAEGAQGVGELAAGLMFSILLGVFVGWIGVLPAVSLTALPALVVGALLWTAGRSRPWARRPAAFAATGAVFGLAACASLVLTGLTGSVELPDRAALAPSLLALDFLLAGAGSGLMFRATMILTGRFIGDDREGESGELAG